MLAELEAEAQEEQAATEGRAAATTTSAKENPLESDVDYSTEKELEEEGLL